MLTYYTQVHVTGTTGIHLKKIRFILDQFKLFRQTGSLLAWLQSFTQKKPSYADLHLSFAFEEKYYYIILIEEY
jgi:hypothetical protein